MAPSLASAIRGRAGLSLRDPDHWAVPRPLYTGLRSLVHNWVRGKLVRPSGKREGCVLDFARAGWENFGSSPRNLRRPDKPPQGGL